MSLVEVEALARRDRIGRAEAFLAPKAVADEVVGAACEDDLARNVYCVLGLPIDVLDIAAVLHRIEAAAASRAILFISTPNLNFLANSRSDAEFRESLLESDLCPADGMPIVWIARLIGVPIKTRV